MRRRAANMRNNATSAVASLTAIGVLATEIPLREHAATLMLSYPAPLWQINFRLSGSSSISSSLKFPVILFESLLRYITYTPLKSPFRHFKMKSSRDPNGYSFKFAIEPQSFHSFRACVISPMRSADICEGILK